MKTIANLIELTTHMIWNDFYNFVWKDRCIKVNEWEKEQNIKKKDKRKSTDKKNNTLSNAKKKKNKIRVKEKKVLVKEKEVKKV